MVQTGPTNIPDLCEGVDYSDEIRLMDIVANLQLAGMAKICRPFDKIYRGDGGTMYLARYELT